MNALESFIKESATSYLQSVVFVDDHIYHVSDKPLETSTVELSKGGLKPMFTVAEPSDSKSETAKKPLETTESPQAEAALEATDPGQSDIEVVASPYHPRQLMESFAQKGIVCALYEPRVGFETTPTSELFRLCERADVIILDWYLHNDGGDGVSDLLAELIAKSESELPHHVRMCAIYTSEQRLHDVMNKLLNKLKYRGCEAEVAKGRLQLIAGASRISVFGKPAGIIRSQDDAKYEVAEEELAERIISEFAGLHHGILPAFALHGLASVRRNTKRLLDKFRGEMDGSFLLHRALVLGTTEAFDELPELLSDEIRAVIEDSWPGKVSLSDVATAAVGSLPIKPPSKPWKSKDGKPFDAESCLREMLQNGHPSLAKYRKTCNQLKDLDSNSFQKVSPTLLASFESMLSKEDDCWPERLAALFCNRTQYGDHRRKLQFGTIVRHRDKEEGPWSFSVCLMPICDGQRLKKGQNFPFWKLRDNAKCGQPQKRYGVAIELDGVTYSFAAGGKLRDMLWLAHFEPDTSKCVVAVQNNNAFIFQNEGMLIEWVAELKPLHAQRIAAHMGNDVSRVGLVESEWLRLFCDR